MPWESRSSASSWLRDRSVIDGPDRHPPIGRATCRANPERTVRVRLAGERAFLTIKGRTNGASRTEFEYPIPAEDAPSLLALCETPLIEKTRHRIVHAGLTWEIDVFHEENEGLVVAEVELQSTDQRVDLPEWAGDEVTSDPRYVNANLVGHPYRVWR